MITTVALFYTLDTARVNAKTLYCLAQGKHPRSYDSFKFGWDLMLSLVRPFAELRSRNGLQHPIQVKMDILLGKPTLEVEEAEPPAKQRKRCHIHCEIVKSAEERRNAPKSTKTCGECGKNVCGKCFKLVCVKCSREQKDV